MSVCVCVYLVHHHLFEQHTQETMTIVQLSLAHSNVLDDHRKW
jgi:hypothetical protein